MLFLNHFAPGTPFDEARRICWSGLRLDLALLGVESALIGLLLLIRRRIRLDRLVIWLWALTGLHLFVCVANFATFTERGQNAGELLLPYITSPWQVFLAVGPFLQAHWPAMAALALVLGIYFWLGWRVSRRFVEGRIDLWRDKKVLIYIGAAGFFAAASARKEIQTR
jgi:hypothetical protein